MEKFNIKVDRLSGSRDSEYDNMEIKKEMIFQLDEDLIAVVVGDV